MSNNGPNLRIHKTAQDAAEACSEYILDALKQTLANQSRATLAISGGSSPRLLFGRMAAAGFDWSRVDFFLGR